MSITFVVGGFGSGAIGYHGTVLVKSSYAVSVVFHESSCEVKSRFLSYIDAHIRN